MPGAISRTYRTVSAVRGCCLTIAVIIVLLGVAGCVSLVFMAGRATAAPSAGPDIMLVIDQSASLWELAGIGSDPDMLRVDAARLLINTLGVDQDLDYRLGIIDFGTNAELVAPLSPLTNTKQRQALLEKIANPEPMGWTDVNEALDLAGQALAVSQPAPGRQPTIILLTDGRPETEQTDTDTTRLAYLEELEVKVHQFAEQGVTLYTILLSNKATDADPELQTVYRPLWLGLSQELDEVHFYEARTATDLPAIYHTIAVALQGSRTAGPVIDGTIGGQVVEAVPVEPGLSRVTFVIRKSEPDIAVEVARPDGELLQAQAQDVKSAGDRLQEVWSIREPEAGTWRIVLTGQGGVTVWKDYMPVPTPTGEPTNTLPPTSTPTEEPTNTPIPSSTEEPTNTPVVPVAQQITTAEVDGKHPSDEPPPRSGIGVTLAGVVGIVIPGLLATVIGSTWYWWGQKHPVPVEGRLHLIRTPEGERPGQRWELGPRNKKRITIGGADSDIPLTDGNGMPAQAVEIIGRQNGQHGVDIRLRPLGGNSTCRVNDNLVRYEQPLWDRDEIQIGEYVLRYENLDRRRGDRGARRRTARYGSLKWR